MTDRSSVLFYEENVHRSKATQDRLKKRYAAERRFKYYGLVAISLAVLSLSALMISIFAKGYSAFWQHSLQAELYIDPQLVDPKSEGTPEALRKGDYRKLLRSYITDLFPDVSGRRDLRKLISTLSPGAEVELRETIMGNPDLVGQTITLDLPISDDGDMFFKGYIDPNRPQSERRLNDKQIAWFRKLENDGFIQNGFNWRLLTYGDSREPEMAGVLGAVMGSLFTMLVTLALAFPIAVAAAIYLEEFAPKNWITDLIEVNINNLAAVPSIIFGLLGLAIFINFFGLPRSAPLVGGMVLALMTLPTIIIAARASLKAVPPSIREAALGIGASKVQTVFQHVLPLAMPGILTGSIIGMAQALGETAPLLMIGMVAFVADIPSGITSPAAALPVQVFLWADSPERAFVERTSAAIIILLAFLIVMNLLAIVMRKRFERRW